MSAGLHLLEETVSMERPFSTTTTLPDCLKTRKGPS